MKDLHYNIHDFNWDNDTKTFYGNERNLYPINTSHYYQISFPNQRGQFFIKNMTTSGFRRFRYNGEIQLTDTDVIWRYMSEDGMTCDITKHI